MKSKEQRIVKCPSCGSGMTEEGQPSNRVFYACGSYGYDGLDRIRNQSKFCESQSEMRRISELVRLLSDSPKSLTEHMIKWANERFPTDGNNQP
jgi:hypothetical protein